MTNFCSDQIIKIHSEIKILVCPRETIPLALFYTCHYSKLSHWSIFLTIFTKCYTEALINSHGKNLSQLISRCGHLIEAQAPQKTWFLIKLSTNQDVRYRIKPAKHYSNGMASFNKKLVWEVAQGAKIKIAAYDWNGSGKMGKKTSKHLGDVSITLDHKIGPLDQIYKIGSHSFRFVSQIAPCIRHGGKTYFGDHGTGMVVDGINFDFNNIARGKNVINGKAYDVQGMGWVWGKIKVVAIDAKDVPKMDLIGSSDCFLKFVTPGVTLTSKVIKNSLTPKWNETLETEINYLEDLEVTLLDWDLLSGNDVIGEVKLDLRKMNFGQVLDFALKFPEKKKKTPTANIQICLTPYDNSGYRYPGNAVYSSAKDIADDVVHLRHKEAKLRQKRHEKEMKKMEERMKEMQNK